MNIIQITNKFPTELDVFKYNNRKNDDMFETLVKFSMLNK